MTISRNTVATLVSIGVVLGLGLWLVFRPSLGIGPDEFEPPVESPPEVVAAYHAELTALTASLTPSTSTTPAAIHAALLEQRVPKQFLDVHLHHVLRVQLLRDTVGEAPSHDELSAILQELLLATTSQ